MRQDLALRLQLALALRRTEVERTHALGSFGRRRRHSGTCGRRAVWARCRAPRPSLPARLTVRGRAWHDWPELAGCGSILAHAETRGTQREQPAGREGERPALSRADAAARRRWVDTAQKRTRRRGSDLQPDLSEACRTQTSQSGPSVCQRRTELASNPLDSGAKRDETSCRGGNKGLGVVFVNREQRSEAITSQPACRPALGGLARDARSKPRPRFEPWMGPQWPSVQIGCEPYRYRARRLNRFNQVVTDPANLTALPALCSIARARRSSRSARPVSFSLTLQLLQRAATSRGFCARSPLARVESSWQESDIAPRPRCCLGSDRGGFSPDLSCDMPTHYASAIGLLRYRGLRLGPQ